MGGQRKSCPDGIRITCLTHYSGDVCETYYNTGRCEEGPNCKFAHPPADEDEPIIVSDSESSTIPLGWSPHSPLSPVAPTPIMLMLPPSPRATPPPQHIVQSAGECRIVLNGETLEPCQEVDCTVEEEAGSSATPTDGALLSARVIVRPVSTPPATTTTFKKVERVS